MTFEWQQYPKLPNPRWFIPVVALLLSLIIVFMARAEEYSDTAIANAIYKAEGGKGYNYGIKSVRFKDEAEARQICLNTIRNQRKRHALHKCGRDFLTCLWYRYCPPSAHKLNKNWLKNVLYYLKRG